MAQCEEEMGGENPEIREQVPIWPREQNSWLAGFVISSNQTGLFPEFLRFLLYQTNLLFSYPILGFNFPRMIIPITQLGDFETNQNISQRLLPLERILHCRDGTPPPCAQGRRRTCPAPLASFASAWRVSGRKGLINHDPTTTMNVGCFVVSCLNLVAFQPALDPAAPTWH